METEFYVWGVLLVFIIGALFLLMGGPISAPAFELGNTPTGQVISSEHVGEPCGCLPDKPVCGAIGHHLETYLSTCHAECFGAKVIYKNRCAAIPSRE